MYGENWRIGCEAREIDYLQGLVFLKICVGVKDYGVCPITMECILWNIFLNLIILNFIVEGLVIYV